LRGEEDTKRERKGNEGERENLIKMVWLNFQRKERGFLPKYS
jgi:hypothetical protein